MSPKKEVAYSMLSPQKKFEFPKFECFLLLFLFTLVGLPVAFTGSEPTLYIQDLYVPALTETTKFNTSVFVDLKFERTVTLFRSSYADFQMTLLYATYGSSTLSPVGTSMFHGFDMGWKKRVHVKAAVEAVGLPWQEAVRAVSAGNVVVMAVELVVRSTSVTRPFVVVAHVPVDDSGHMFSKDPIEFEKQ